MKKLTIIFLFSLLGPLGIAAKKKPLASFWIPGDVPRALELAAKKKKNIFLYWGAIWCPPCNQIKKTIFSTPKFKEEITHFIPVYIDGDGPNAQKWADKYHTKGYPTMIILSSEGKELIRLTTGLQLNQFIEILRQYRGQKVQNSTSLINRALAKKLGLQGWKILGGHSFYQDHLQRKGHLSKEKRLETFKQLWKNTPSTLPSIQSLFFIYYLSELGKGIKEKRKIKHEPNKVHYTHLMDILSDEKKVIINLERLTNDTTAIISAGAGSKKDWQKEIEKSYLKAMEKILNNSSLSHDERLMSLLPEFFIFQKNNGEKVPLPKSYGEKVKKWAFWADEEIKDTYSRHSAMSTGAYLLKKAGLLNIAIDFNQKQIKKSNDPILFMNNLSSLYSELQNIDAEIKWKKQAWIHSKGHATRFEFGNRYLILLLKKAPQNFKEIQTSLKFIYSEIFASADMDFGRNNKKRENLKTALKKYKKKFPQEYGRLIKALKNTCVQSTYKNCKQFLMDFTDAPLISETSKNML